MDKSEIIHALVTLFAASELITPQSDETALEFANRCEANQMMSWSDAYSVRTMQIQNGALTYDYRGRSGGHWRISPQASIELMAAYIELTPITA